MLHVNAKFVKQLNLTTLHPITPMAAETDQYPVTDRECF